MNGIIDRLTLFRLPLPKILIAVDGGRKTCFKMAENFPAPEAAGLTKGPMGDSARFCSFYALMLPSGLPVPVFSKPPQKMLNNFRDVRRSSFDLIGNVGQILFSNFVVGKLIFWKFFEQLIPG